MKNEWYTGAKFVLLAFALGLGTFIQILDVSIANVAVPYIAGNLAASADDGTWVITSFAASNAIVLPLTGWLSDYFGRVRLFVWSVLMFSFISFLCGFSSSLAMLIFFRVIQGAVAGSLIPLSQSLLVVNSPPDKQGSVLGFWAMVVVVAPVVGPILGGYLTETYSWPWIFYINVPIGIFSATIVWTLLKDRESEIVRNPIDWFGLFLLSLGVACLQIMLDKGKDLDWFDSNVIIILTVTSAVSLTYFVVWNSFTRHPIVDFSFFFNRNFLFGTITITIGYLIFFGSTVIIPLWLQTEEGYTAFWAGIAVAPIGIIPVLFSVAVGSMLKNFDLRAVSSFSFFIFALTFFYQSSFISDINIEKIMLSRFLQGFAIVIFFLPLIQITLGDIPNNKYASASGLTNFIRILVGSGFGTSLSVALWSRLEIFHHSRITENITSYRKPVIELYDKLKSENTAFTTDRINEILDRAVEQQAYTLATDDISWVAAWTLVMIMPLPFLCKKIKKDSLKQVSHAE